MAEAIALSLPLTQQLVEIAREQRLVEAQGTLHAGSGSEMAFQLSDAGKARALDALSQSEYYGALPVPLDKYKEQVQNQSVKNVQITRDRLLANMGHLILPEELLENLGPAVSSGRSVLLYGPPGNGKSAISNGIRDALGDVIYIPHCIEYAGQVITLFDRSRCLTRLCTPRWRRRPFRGPPCGARIIGMTSVICFANAPP